MQNYPHHDPHEREPLDSSSRNFYDSPSRGHGHYNHEYPESDSPYYDAPPRHHYEQPYTRNQDGPYTSSEIPYARPAPGYGSPRSHREGPVPPPHGDSAYHSGDRGRGLPPTEMEGRQTAESASGGMAGIAYSVADRNARESGLQAMRSTGQVPPPPSRAHNHNVPRQPPPAATAYGLEHGYESSSSLAAPGHAAMRGDSRSPSRSPRSYGSGDPYSDDPYQGYSSTGRAGDPNLGVVNPMEIEDDGDDGLHYPGRSQRNSMLSSSNSDRGARSAAGAASAAGGAAAAGGLLGKSNLRDVGGYYESAGPEKPSAWRREEEQKSKKWKWAVIIIVVLIIIGAVVGGVVGGVVTRNKKSGGGSGDSTSSDGQSAEDDVAQNGDLNSNSKEIKELLNNPDLHKVFPGMDYTPINTQYPDCIHNPPSQNNVTRDVAVLSQLTNKIRLYGTDCNQTQMVIHAINQLKLTNDVKIWMGVWQDGNVTTNDRQLEQMWDILDEYGQDPFEGIIVANEILFREEMDITELGTLLDGVRTNLSAKNFDLHVATSDLGDDWKPGLAASSDYIMANIHPFFAGVAASEAASWTWTFWEGQNGPLWKKDKSMNIISETGWPTSGGKNCGSGSTTTTCSPGSVAGIDELNQFMEDWVCQALNNGTQYFWFEAFDEPWKIRFNEDGKEWEDKWGLMDVNRNLKDGVKIPDCGGKTV